MQMLCKVSEAFSDLRCPVCEQGFLVYWTRVAAKNRETQKQDLLDGLRRQHKSESSPEAHPATFHLADNPVSASWNETSPLAMPVLLGVYN